MRFAPRSVVRRALERLGLLAFALLASAVTAAPKPANGPVIPKIITRPPDRATLTSDQKKAETNAAKLFVRAQNAMQVGDYASALANYKDVLALFEQAYGPAHERLAEPLSGIVATRMTQYVQDLVQRAHPSTAILKPAVEAQKRMVQIYDGLKGVDPTQHVDIAETLGDLYLYVGDGEHGVAAYRDAYQLQARLFSADSAEEMFADVKLVGFLLPANPPSHPDWTITVGFDVAADSRVSVADFQSDASPNINKAMRENYTRARARPRFAAGEPVASALSVRYVYRTNGDIATYAVKPR